MLLAVFSDIHGNRQAFEACLKAARAKGAERFVLLGDFVGYGADPEWVVDTVMELVAQGAVAVRGNHDQAVNSSSETMNDEAQIAIEWTRGRLDVAQRRFLAELPMLVEDGDRLFVHSEASQPAALALHSLDGGCCQEPDIDARPCHLLRPHPPSRALFDVGDGEDDGPRAQDRRVRCQLLRGRQWLAVLGSVGQPRDGDPSAAFVLFDTVSCQITYCRAPYDIASAANRIRENGLPHWLADRLSQGR